LSLKIAQAAILKVGAKRFHIGMGEIRWAALGPKSGIARRSWFLGQDAAIGFRFNQERFLKITKPKPNPNAGFCLPQIPALHIALLYEGAFAQSVNRTKTFHVKHFCPIGP